MEKKNNTDVELLKSGDMICRNTRFCMRKEIGLHNNIYGAILMEELDSVCAVFAAEACDTPMVVTRKMDIDFVSTIKEGQIFKTYIGIELIGNTSITLKVEVRKHSVHTEKETLAIKAKAVFVRIDEDGNSILINDNVRRKFGYEPINK